jgi:hypothetical protein
VNPASNGASLNYTLNGQQFTIKPGEEQSLNQGAPIAFDRGSSLGTAQYDLTEGIYQFGVGQDGGWDLFRTANSRVAESGREGRVCQNA